VTLEHSAAGQVHAVWTPPTSLPVALKHLTLCFTGRKPSTSPPPLIRLHDARVWAALLAVFARCPLESLTVRAGQPDAATIALPVDLGAQVVRYWGRTLRRLNATRVDVLAHTLKTICEGALGLEQLTVDIPKDTDRVMSPPSPPSTHHAQACPSPSHCTVQTFCWGNGLLQAAPYCR
jgi:hypothetical protein